MSEPPRLLAEWDNDLGRAALSSARLDSPPSGAAERAAAALAGAMSVAALTAATAANGTAATSAVTTSSMATSAGGMFGLAKVVAIGSLLVGGTVAGAKVAGYLSSPRSSPPSAKLGASPSVSNSPAPPQVVEAPAPVNVPAKAAPQGLTPMVAGTRPSARTSTLPLELAALDQARVALSNGQSRHALTLLADHDARFPRGVLSSEATLLRVEALIGTGDTKGARALAERFIAANPGSPHVQRLRSLCGREMGTK